MNVSSIEIRQQFAKLGMESKRASLTIEQPRADLSIQTTRPEVSIESPRGELLIDQSRAWDALALGDHLQSMNQIYSAIKNIVMQTIGKIVDEGNQLAAIHNDTNAIADIAQDITIDFFELEFAGYASFDNVDISYTARKPEIEVERGTVNLEAQANKPIINSEPAKLDIYMLQRNSLEIIPPQLDIRV